MVIRPIRFPGGLQPALSEKDNLNKIIVLEPYIQGVRLRAG